MKKFLLPTMAVVALVGASSSVLAVENVLENTQETVSEEKTLLRASDLIDKDNLSMQDIMDKIVGDFQTNGSDSLIIKDLIDTIGDYPSLQLELTMKFLYVTNSMFGNYLGDLVEDLGSENIATIGEAITSYLEEQKEVLPEDEYIELYTRVNEVTVQLYNELVKHVDDTENLTTSEYETFKMASEFDYLSQTSLEELNLTFDEVVNDVENSTEGGNDLDAEEATEEGDKDGNSDGSEESNSEETEEVVDENTDGSEGETNSEEELTTENTEEENTENQFESEEDAPEGAICGDSSDAVTTEDSASITETENCIENSDGQDVIAEGEDATEDITSVIIPSGNNPTTSTVTVSEGTTETLPQTGMESSATTGGLVAMLLGLLTFGIYSRKNQLSNK